MRRICYSVLCLFVTVGSAEAQRTCYVRDGGTATGSNGCFAAGGSPDWSDNAKVYDQLTTAEAAINRSNGAYTIYVADGTYTSFIIDAAAVGTTPITIKKATAADHGTETGWSSAFGDGVAIFSGTSSEIDAEWVTFDGAVGGGPNNWKTGHGFQIGPPCSGCNGLSVDFDNVTISRVKFFGNGPDGNCTTSTCDGGDEDLLSIAPTAGNVTVSRSFFDNSGRTLVFSRSQGPVTFQWNYLGTFESVSTEHSEAMALGNPSSSPIGNWTIRWNVINCGEGTGGVIINGDADVYGNVFVDGTENCDWGSNGAVAGWSWGDWNAVNVYNNSFIDVSRPVSPGNSASTGCSSCDGSGLQIGQVYNNLFYSSSAPTFGNLTHDYNHYVDNSSPTETNKTTGTGNPFTNYVSLDFRLNSGTTAGITLSAPYNVDMCGNTRGADGTWDRGAIEFVSGQPACADPEGGGSPPPTGPTVTITTPTTSTTYDVSVTPLASLAGTASDDGSVTGCTGSADTTGAFTVTGTTSWSATNIALNVGPNVLTVTCTDNSSLEGSDTLTVTYTVPPSGPADNFNRANAGTLGANWTVQTTNSPVLSSNEAVRNTAGGNQYAFWNAHTPAANQFSQAVVRSVASSSRNVRVTCRAGGLTDSTYDHYHINTDGASGEGHTQLNKVVDGSVTMLVAYATTTTAGDVIRIECSGTSPTTIKFLKNGMQIGSDYVDSSSPLTSGQYGIGFFGSGATLDDWQGGDLGAGDTTDPSVTITTPTSNATFSTGSATLTTLAGTCSDDVGVSQVAWINDRGGSGTATGTTSWSVSNIALQTGANVLTVTCTDTSANDSTDQLTVSYSPSNNSKRRLRVR